MELAGLHLRNQLCHGALRIPAQGVPVFGFLFVDVEQILSEDPSAEGGLHLPDALFGEIALLEIGGKHYHVDVNAVLLAVEGGVPAQVFQRDPVPPWRSPARRHTPAASSSPRRCSPAAPRPPAG